MAKQKKTPAKNAYEILQDSYGAFKIYSDVMTGASEGKFSPKLRGLAANVIPDKEVDAKRAVLNPHTPLESTVGFVAAGLEKYSKEFESYARDNLETIIDAAPNDALESTLLYVTPKTNTKNKKYNGVAKLHKESNEFLTTVLVYERDDTPKKTKKAILNKMGDSVISYYETEYSDNETLKNAFMSLATYSEPFRENRYKTLAAEKTQGFIKALGKDIKPYLKTVVAKDERAGFCQVLVGEKPEIKAA